MKRSRDLLARQQVLPGHAVLETDALARIGAYHLGSSRFGLGASAASPKKEATGVSSAPARR